MYDKELESLLNEVFNVYDKLGDFTPFALIISDDVLRMPITSFTTSNEERLKKFLSLTFSLASALVELIELTELTGHVKFDPEKFFNFLKSYAELCDDPEAYYLLASYVRCRMYYRTEIVKEVLSMLEDNVLSKVNDDPRYYRIARDLAIVLSKSDETYLNKALNYAIKVIELSGEYGGIDAITLAKIYLNLACVIKRLKFLIDVETHVGMMREFRST